jgi:hypothetical protein
LVFPAARLSLPIRWFPLRRRGTALPHVLPDCHLVRTAILFLPHIGQPRCFPPQSIRFLASFAAVVSRSRGPPRLRPEPGGLTSHSPWPRKAGYICTQHYGQNARCTALQVSNPFRTQAGIPQGSTSVHKNRSPRKQGQSPHAIGGRPESASAQARFPPAPTRNWAFQASTRGFIAVPL